jgi:hypothetical protein
MAISASVPWSGPAAWPTAAQSPVLRRRPGAAHPHSCLSCLSTGLWSLLLVTVIAFPRAHTRAETSRVPIPALCSEMVGHPLRTFPPSIKWEQPVWGQLTAVLAGGAHELGGWCLIQALFRLDSDLAFLL